ncbi:sulfate transporter [Bradyrhizobium sp. SSBR45G]|uniref:STAS domain-containing protein n=1 Tax=unclassified Bradyrhizobium TaxID=2631580 RepID=UPI002342AA4B|nr:MULTISPECIES: STAS domain-containing protein [unclassified Bradyrhizobium]GLH81959.1 sulfate transporter [Bradyrhizobium sp. SSBR45G]GLH89438.1 sulfate transporter [Bradyrhizobium sp. SSBR45R]
MVSEYLKSKEAVKLPADCSIAAIREVHEMIRDAFGQRAALEIDGSCVDKADVTSIQLLISTAKTGRDQGRAVALTAPSEVLRNAIRRAGFAGDAAVDRHFAYKKDGI